MQIQIEIPDDIAQALSAPDLCRAALEAVALEGYRARRLGGGQARKLLGFRTPMQLHAFLKEHGVYLNYSIEDLERDAAVAERLYDAQDHKRTA